MSIKSELRREGIVVIKQLNTLKVNAIAANIAQKLVSNFPAQNFNYYELFAKISSLNMYIARIPNGVAAKYFYKNSSIYFSEHTDLENLNQIALHECIHVLQSEINSKNNLVKLGLCDFSDSRLSGMGLNEAAVQLMTMKATKTKMDTVKYFDIELPSNSPDYYTLECNLVRQMAYITGEYVLYNSTLYGNDNFKNKFIALTSKQAFETIKNNINSIIYLEDELNRTLEKAQNSNVVNKQTAKLVKKSTILKAKIKNTFLETQNKIFTSFFDNLFTYSSIQNFRQALYNYRKLIGVTDDYNFFNEYYINKMTELEGNYNMAAEKHLALIPVKNTLFARAIRKLKILVDAAEAHLSNVNIK